MPSFHSLASSRSIGVMSAAEPAKLAESNRLTTCLLPECGRLFAVCRGCDRGRRYCSDECSSEARRSKQRLAGARYQATEQGRRKHAERQARYLGRRRVTHQRSPPLAEIPANSGVQSEVAPVTPSQRRPTRPPAPASRRAVEVPVRQRRDPACASCICCGIGAAFVRMWPLNGAKSQRR